MNLLETLGRRALFFLEPERAHRLGLDALKSGVVGALASPHPDPLLRTHIAGLALPNPIGVAAGFDKDGEVPDALLALGFGFTEIGTVTPRPQAGNPKPRVFRLEQDRGVINRLGFNNGGHEAAYKRLFAAKRDGIVGVNIGANKDADDRIADYVTGIERFSALASYFTVNISSPNTPGLRDLQGEAQLNALLERVAQARAAQTSDVGRHVPIFVKIAPDIAEGDLPGIVGAVRAHGMDGMIVSNTTLSRATLGKDPKEAGGLSGRPVFERATIMLAKTRQIAGPDMALIGVGGVECAETALTKIKAGADAVQLYTGMIYGGPKIAQRICAGIARHMRAKNFTSVQAMRDLDVDKWAAKTPL